MNPNDFQYRIIKDDENYKNILIEKSGIKGEFTIKAIEDHEAYLIKAKEETQGKLKIEEAKVANIEEHHPFVKDLTDEQLFTVAMYGQAKLLAKQGKEKELEIAKILLDYAVEKSHIIKTLSIDTEEKTQGTPSEILIPELQPNAEKKD